MRVYIQIKQLGKRKCSIEKIPIDFPVPPVNVQGLIEAIVSWQVCEYNERLQQSEVLKYLTQEEVENKTASGKVGFAVNYRSVGTTRYTTAGRKYDQSNPRSVRIFVRS